MGDLIPQVGKWFWLIAACVLLILELTAPGVFFIWLAFAAATVGVATYVIHLSWQIEAVLFAGLSLAYVYLCGPWYSGLTKGETDQPHLNQRIHDHVGKSFVLVEPIVGGHGKLDIGGTRWDILGPDMAAGTVVKVNGVEGQKLRVSGG
jgi:inner membrane protein